MVTRIRLSRRVWRGALGVMIMLGVVSIGLIGSGLCWASNMLKSKPGPMIWSDYRGIGCIPKTGAQDILYALRTRNGALIFGPRFAFWHGQLVYWSPADKAFGIMPPTGKTHWVQAAKSLPEGWDVGAIYPSPTGIVVNLHQVYFPQGQMVGSKGVYRYCCYVFDLRKGIAHKLDDAQEARSSQDSSELIVLNTKNQMERRIGNERTIIISNADPQDDFDYSFFDGSFCVTTSRETYVVDRNGHRHKGGWLLNSVRAVSIQPEKQQVWATLDTPMTYFLLSFNYDGKLLGTLLQSNIPEFGSPMMSLTPDIQRLLNRLGGLRPGDGKA